MSDAVKLFKIVTWQVIMLPRSDNANMISLVRKRKVEEL